MDYAFFEVFLLSHLSGLFARKKGTGQVPFSSAAIFYEAISAVKTFLKTEGHLHHERRDVCVSDKQDENCFESSENRSFFMPYCSYAHGNHRKYGNCFEKSLDNLLVKAWGV